MKKTPLIHTPEGVRDLYNQEYAKKQSVISHMEEVQKRYGYRGIETPEFEFFDIFSKEKGSATSREMYKFFDRDGETLVLRPDITPSVARCAAKYFMEEEMPIRLCYCGNTFMNNSSLQGRLKEQTQLGAELIGDSSAAADAEMAAMIIDCLLAAGLKDFQIEIGEINYYRGLMAQIGLEEEEQEELREQIENKNYFGLEELILARKLPENWKQTLLALPELFGGRDKLDQAAQMAPNETCKNAVARLQEVYRLLTCYGKEQYVTFDLSMLSKYQYYTGMIFKAITYGTGESIGNGGRYDRLLPQFGKESASIGFAVSVDQLLLAMERQQLPIETDMADTVLVYEEPVTDEAIAMAAARREEGERILLMKREEGRDREDYFAYISRNDFSSLLYLDQEGRLHEFHAEVVSTKKED